MHIENIDLRVLRCFVALMEDRSVSRTADRLGLTQPAISHTLARLRTLFDDPLLLRAQGGMTPTPRALELDRTVRHILAEVGKLGSPAEPFDPAVSKSTFVLTATEYGEYVLAPRLFAGLESLAPYCSIEFRRPDRNLFAGWLERGEIDLRIGWVRDANALLRSAPLFTDRLVCLARRDHAEVRGGLSLDQYLSLPHVRSWVSTTSGHEVDEAVHSIGGGQLRLALRVNSSLAVPAAVARSNLLATVPERLAIGFADRLELQVLELPLKLPAIRYALFWHERSHRDTRHRWLRQLVVRVAKEVGRQGRADALLRA
jgi:DNA-binding transcriptional LysR family regulator